MNEPLKSNQFDDEDGRSPQPLFSSEGMSPLDESESNGHTLVWLMLGVAAMGCGLLVAAGLFFFRTDAQELYDQYFPSPTATFTNTPRPTATITPTPTLTPTPTPNLTAQAYEGTAVHAADAWTSIVAESFDSNSHKWYVGEEDDKYALKSYEVRDGKYIWEATAHQGFVQRLEANVLGIKDFYFSVEIAQPELLANVDYGFYFREDNDNNHYYFGINNDGEFSLWLYNDAEWTQLIEDGTSTAFARGGANKVSMIAEGDHFIFFVNDVYAAEFFDSTLASGTTGMAIEISEPGLHATFEFDNLIVNVKN